MNKILYYSLMWNCTDNSGILTMLLAGDDQTTKVVFTNGSDFSAAATILRSDPDHAVYFDTATGCLSTGKDKP